MTPERYANERDAHAPRIDFIDLRPRQQSFESAVLQGMAQHPKHIPCRFLYDARGSALFDEICTLPEYYLTRAETEILSRYGRQIAAWAGPRVTLIELGSGCSAKTRLVLDALSMPRAYVPIDISGSHLRTAATSIAEAYAPLQVVAICTDYSEPLSLPPLGSRRIAFFPGSTIGNLPHDEALALLRMWRAQIGPDGSFILGADLRKDAAVLNAAYNDGAGVTRAFITNILARMNAELGADIDPETFEYDALFNSDASRVEMHLRSRIAQRMRIAGRVIPLAAGERIHIENSHKYTLPQLSELAHAARFRSDGVLLDNNGLFSVHLWRAV